MSTLWQQLGLQVRARGTIATVAATPRLMREAGESRLAPPEDRETVVARIRKLGDHKLEEAARLGWCSFPLKGTNGLFEVRKNGVRVYGGRIGVVDSMDAIVLLGAEQKAGRTSADPDLLRRCSDELEDLRRKLG